jgi:hypothetical protein
MAFSVPRRKKLHPMALGRKWEEMTTSVRQMENAVQVIMNLNYLIEIDVSNPSRVLKYVKMSDPSVKTLSALLAEMRASA